MGCFTCVTNETWPVAVEGLIGQNDKNNKLYIYKQNKRPMIADCVFFTLTLYVKTVVKYSWNHYQKKKSYDIALI